TSFFRLFRFWLRRLWIGRFYCYIVIDSKGGSNPSLGDRVKCIWRGHNCFM
ncbi:4304_t:CDS:1, partial [Funneliformis caledonium]